MRGGTGKRFREFCNVHHIDPHTAVNTLDEKQYELLVYGDGGKTIFCGLIPWLLGAGKRDEMGNHQSHLLYLSGILSRAKCPKCGGSGLGEAASHTHICDKTITEMENMYIRDLRRFFTDNALPGKRLTQEILIKLECMDDVGLHHLALSRSIPSLSGGEAQRIKLAAELGKTGSVKDRIYILDEPTTGLSFYDCERLIKLMQELVDSGATVIVTEHDPAVLSNCDYLIEMGPGGGSDGGYIIATGTPKELKSNEKSIIGKYMK
jgi:excinuclease UvrABC ATPase subunit